MQALMLAAGMGKRLGKFTGNNTKCMVEVAGKKLIDRAIDSIKNANIEKFIIVTGYKSENLVSYIKENYSNSGIEFIFVYNDEYANSNNIVSLYMAKDYIVSDDTILLESDLIFDDSLIKRIKENEDKNLAVVAKYESWMDGTVVTCNDNGTIASFVDKKNMSYDNLDSYYKTVNVYKFSKEFAKNVYIPFLEAYMSAYGKNNYYESVLKVIAHLAMSDLKAFFMNDMLWYEIDDAQDLDIANVMFSSGESKYNQVVSKFGGYWRYNKMLDFCYLVNPYFPPKSMVDKLKNEFPILLTQYPSGLNMQNMNAERIFAVNQDNILVGNGAAELINALGLVARGKVAVSLPTFNEYVRCFRDSEIVVIDNSQWGYKHDIEKLKDVAKNVEWLMVVSPDNPSGDLLTKEQVIDLAKHCKKYNTKLVIDESFIDFADKEKRYTLLDNDILKDNDNLVVVKSISKSYGVPALRLGVLASYDVELLTKIRNYMQIWNINSFAEYYLQIYNLYASSYEKACDSIAYERNRFIKELSTIKSIYVYPSQANYIMIDLKETNSYKFCVEMLEKYNIFIKDLSTKNYFAGKNFIRVAIRDNVDNNKFICAIKEVLS